METKRKHRLCAWVAEVGNTFFSPDVARNRSCNVLRSFAASFLGVLVCACLSPQKRIKESPEVSILAQCLDKQSLWRLAADIWAGVVNT